MNLEYMGEVLKLSTITKYIFSLWLITNTTSEYPKRSDCSIPF